MIPSFQLTTLGQTDRLLELGGEFFAYMPDLHTFSLSDAPYKATSDGLFWHADNEDFQRDALARWDPHAAALSYVALTSLFHWEKVGGQWRASGRPLGNAEDSEEEQDSDEEEGAAGLGEDYGYSEPEQ